jgi:hypothetical protein
MSLLTKYLPKSTGINDPRNPKKKNGMFWNPPKYLYLGGAPGTRPQSQEKGPAFTPAEGQNAVGPITDRGKGRR